MNKVGRPPKDERLGYERFFDIVIDFVSSKGFVFIFVLLALIPMVFHSKEVYLRYVPQAGILLAYLYGAVLDGSMLIATLRARLDKDGIAWWSLIYAVMSFGINICLLFDIPLWVGKILIAFMIPFTITYFSHEIPKMTKR